MAWKTWLPSPWQLPETPFNTKVCGHLAGGDKPDITWDMCWDPELALSFIQCQSGEHHSPLLVTHWEPISSIARGSLSDWAKEGFYIMLKGSVQQEDLTLVNMYVPNIEEPKYIKQILLDVKTKIDGNAVIVGDFHTPLTSIQPFLDYKAIH